MLVYFFAAILPYKYKRRETAESVFLVINNTSLCQTRESTLIFSNSQIIAMRNYCNNIHLPILTLRQCHLNPYACFVMKLFGKHLPLPFYFNTIHSSRRIAIKALPGLASVSFYLTDESDIFNTFRELHILLRKINTVIYLFFAFSMYLVAITTMHCPPLTIVSLMIV